MLDKKTLRNAGIVFVVTLGLTLGFFFFAPDSRVNAVTASILRATGHVGQQCMDIVAETLLNPYTAQLMSTKRHEFTVEISYQAENRLGARMVRTEKCFLNEEGNAVDEEFSRPLIRLRAMRPD